MNMEECRQKVNLPSEDLIVLFYNGSPVKRKDIALKVIAKAKITLPSINLHIIEGKIPPKKMPLYLNAVNCLLLTSDHEGSPNIIKESVACQLPIVTVDVGDVKYTLRHDHHSYIAKNRNIDELANAVVTVLKNKERSCARESISYLSEKTIAEKLKRIYLSLLS